MPHPEELSTYPLSIPILRRTSCTTITWSPPVLSAFCPDYIGTFWFSALGKPLRRQKIGDRRKRALSGPLRAWQETKLSLLGSLGRWIETPMLFSSQPSYFTHNRPKVSDHPNHVTHTTTKHHNMNLQIRLPAPTSLPRLTSTEMGS